jgi:alanyl aminopeptidase
MRSHHRVPFHLLAAMGLIAPALANADGARLGHAVIPTAQSVRLTLDPAKHDYSGEVAIDLRVSAALDSFELNARGQRLDRVTLTGADGAIPVTTGTAPHDRLVVRPARRIAAGSYTLDIAFTNDFDTQAASLYRLETGGDSYAFTQFEADDARGAFPCWDEPEFKIPWRVTLIVRDGQLAIANTLVERESVADGMRTVAFRVTKPLPSYLLAFAVGPLEAVPIPGMSVPGRVITVKGASALATDVVRQTPPLLAALERYFGRPYPYEKLDLLAVPEFLYGAMENAGAITFADRILLMDPNSSGVQQRRRLAEINAHEMAHMWFGDLVTMQWWDDLWLNESFASWLGDKITQQVFPEFDSAVRELEGSGRALATDSRLSTRAIRQPVDQNVNLEQIADVLAYNKGQAVLGMFEHWLGPDVFRKGVVAYLDAHANGNATATDLWSALSKASGRDVGAAMSTFLDQPGVPLVSVEPLAGGRLRLTQRRFLNYGSSAPDPQLWKIPVVLEFSEGGRVHTQPVLLTAAEQTVSLDGARAPAWIHPNADERGYYRWSLPAADLDRLAAAGAMGTRERVGFLANAGALLDAGAMHGDDYLRTIERFRDDPQPEVVDAVAGALGRVKRAFVTPELHEAFARYVRETLGPAFHRVGYATAPGEPPSLTSLRGTLIGWLGDDGRDPDAIAHAGAMTRDYLRDPASIDPSLADAALRLAAIGGDAALYDEIQKRFETARSPVERTRALMTLGSFRDPALIERTLAYALAGPLRPQELRFITQGIGAEPSGEQRLFEWMTEHYAAIVSRMPPNFAAFMPAYAGGCSAQRLEAARAFFASPEHSTVGTAQQLAKVADQVNDCVGLRGREGAAVAANLRAARAAN